MLLTADGGFNAVTEITPERLKKRGIKLVLADLDNTLAPYNATTPTEEILRWHSSLKSAGITLCIVSNNKKASGLEYLKKLGAPYIVDARKPRPGSLLRAMAEHGADKGNTVLVGDQTFTDVLSGRLAGIPVLMVKPVKLEDLPRTLRYHAEALFRLGLKKRDFFGIFGKNG